MFFLDVLRDAALVLVFSLSLFCFSSSAALEPAETSSEAFAAACPVEKRRAIPAFGSYDIIYRSAPSRKLQELGKSSVTICLRNGLVAHVISDPNLLQSAAGMYVGSGSWSNPVDAPGLAHFIEHLLFMGSKKYPVETDFTRYVSERGGEYNAFTSHDKTVYGFSINHEGLEGGIDRFAQFFTAPLFSPSAILREKHAVHHEFEDHRNSDEMRIWRVLKETGNNFHVNHLFSCGSLESLASIGQKDIHQWYSKHYVAQNMKLIVVSSRGLQELIGMIVQSFANVQKGEKPALDFSGSLLSSQQQGHMIYVTPNHNNRSLQLIWEIPLAGEGTISSLELVQLALDHEGEGSLFSILASEGLARGVGVDHWQLEKNHLLFLIEIALTKKGVQSHEMVLAHCFSVLQALKKQGVPEELYQKIMETRHELENEYTPARPFDFVMAKAATAGEEDASKKTIDAYFHFTQVLSQMTPQLGVYFLMAPSLELPSSLEFLERWMHVPYHRKKIDADVLLSWEMIEAHKEFKLPVKEEEEDIPSLIDFEENSKDIEVLIDEAGKKIAFARKEELGESWVLFFQFKTPLSFSSSHHAASLLLFLAMTYDSLEKQESIDCLSWTMVPLESEITLIVKVEGDDKLEKVVQFFSQLTACQFEKSFFQDCQKNYIDQYMGDPDPLELAQAVAESYIKPGFFTSKDLCSALQKITYDEFSDFQKMLFPSLQVEALLSGPVSKEQALHVWKSVEQIIFSSNEAWNSTQGKKTQGMRWNEPVEINVETHRYGHAFMLVMNLNGASRESWAMQAVLSQILSEEFFDDLRTKQQLAYKLYTWSEPCEGRLLQFFGIQSSTAPSVKLSLAVDRFLMKFTQQFASLVSRDRVGLIKHMIVASLKRRLQSDISADEARSIKASIEVIKALQYEQICTAAQMFFSEKNTKRLAVHIRGQ